MIRLFLSASIPLPHRHPKYLATVDVLAIRDSVKALVSTVLQEGQIVFGGHPAITPLIALLLRGMPTEAKRRIILYQSRFFENDFIDENDAFIDLRLTKSVPGDLNASLAVMRREMISSEKFDAAVFVGGMEGIWTEYHAFREAHPQALCFPVGSTGAAALELYQAIARDRRDLLHELTYPTLFRNIVKEIKSKKKS